jgi:hypothetical protein
MRFCTVLALLILAFPARAADWVALPGAGSADQYSYDRSKLTIKDDEITYWKKVIFKIPQELQGKDVASGLLRERMNCAEHTAKLVSYLYYSPTGETVQYVAQDESETAPIIPDTVGDAFEKVLCPLVWHKQEEARIKAEQKAAAAELAASKKEEKKSDLKPSPASVAPSPRKPAEKDSAAVPPPVMSIPLPQIIEQLY